MSHLAFLPLLLPLIAGSVLILVRGSATRLRRSISLAATVLMAVAAVALVGEVTQDGLQTYALGDWPAPFGIVLVADRLSAGLVAVTALLALCALAHVVVRGSERPGVQFHSLFQFQLFGINGAFLTGDLFNLFVFFEVLLIASYGLLLHGGGRNRVRAGLHYVVLNLVGSALFLFAVGTLYGVVGTLNMADLGQRLAALPVEDTGIVRAAGLLLLVVFGLKAAMVPLHIWLPQAYGNTSAGVAALFAIMTKVGIYAIVRVDSVVFGTAAGDLVGLFDPFLLPLGTVTLVAATVGVMGSRRLGELTGHLVVASVGTLLIGFGLGGTAAAAASLYYLVHSTFAAAALFLLCDILRATRAKAADELRSGPPFPKPAVVGALFVVCAVAIGGVPPLSGFVGKFLILEASVGNAWMSLVLAVVLGTSLLVIIALARGGGRLFYHVDARRPAVAAAVGPADLLPVASLVALGVCLVALAGPVHEYALSVAQQLGQPDEYHAAVLGPMLGRGS